MALFLQSKGYMARALTGGYDAWKNANLPLMPLPSTSVETPMPQVRLRL